MYKVVVEGKNGIVARIVADSISNGKRITTFELEYHRYIHGELLTHTLLARNAMSSRAVPVKSMLEQIRNNPATPIHWGAKQSGMVADNEVTGEALQGIQKSWKELAELVADKSEDMESLYKVHKQVINRLIEPFQMMKTVVTATEFENFFWLRRDKDAQPEFQELSNCMFEAMEQSEPEVLEAGEWHTPYVEHVRGEDKVLQYYVDGEKPLFVSAKEATEISSSCCAQVSYRNIDNSYNKAKSVYERLGVGGNKIHCYDEDTEVLTDKGFVSWKDVDEDTLLGSVDSKTQEFLGFTKPISLVNEYYKGKMYHYKNFKMDLMVTPEHKLYAHKVSKVEDRKSELNLELFRCSDATSNKHRYNTQGECAMRMVRMAKATARLENFTVVDGNQEYVGKLIGMFIGDGSTQRSRVASNQIKFRFRKQRKVDYVLSVVKSLGLEHKVVITNDNVTNITITKTNIGRDFKQLFYTDDWEKTFPSYFSNLNQNFLSGLFDGLKNSDGSIRRNTWCYSTSSEVLADKIVSLGLVCGFAFVKNKVQSGNYKLEAATTGEVKVNYRQIGVKDRSGVDLVDYEGQVYCAEVEGNVLIVRRNGKVILSGNSSPFMHQATPIEPSLKTFTPWLWTKGVTHMDRKGQYWSGNLMGWIQHRQLLDNHTKW